MLLNKTNNIVLLNDSFNYVAFKLRGRSIDRIPE